MFSFIASQRADTSSMFVSYAQNFEDVILWRALKHVKKGFYIDVGAQDPVVDSVSLGFYERGWRGVHVEPTPSYAAKLREARPDETVRQCLIDREEGTKIFFFIPGTGLSTGEAANALAHVNSGHKVEEVSVSSTPLSKLLDESRGRDVHWLKIDVEGMEAAVIDSWLPSDVRPWIVVVESTLPTSSEVNHAAWDEQLQEFGYQFVYFDGLNRFYVSDMHPELKEHFGPGPNVFDSFTLSGLASAPFCQRLNVELDSARAKRVRDAMELDEQLQVLEQNARLIETLSIEVDAQRRELKWRRTSASWIAMLGPWRLGNVLLAPVKRFFVTLKGRLLGLIRRTAENSMLRRIARRLLRPFPAVKDRLARLVTRLQPGYRQRRSVSVPRPEPVAPTDSGTLPALSASLAQWKPSTRINAQRS